jgi:hypothetical protein
VKQKVSAVNRITHRLAHPSDFVWDTTLCSVTRADDLVLLATRDTVLQDVIDRISEMGKYYGMELNVENTRVMRFSRQPSQYR